MGFLDFRRNCCLCESSFGNPGIIIRFSRRSLRRHGCFRQRPVPREVNYEKCIDSWRRYQRTGSCPCPTAHDVKVLISDLKDSIHDKKEKEALTALGAVFRFGPQSVDLLDGVDTVVVSPVIPRENPIVSEAFNRHIDVISEVELAYRVTKAPILAITGTNGKTTTTTLLGSMVSRSGKPFALAGNLGISLSREAELVPADGVIAAEVSSFQLEFIKTFKPGLL